MPFWQRQDEPIRVESLQFPPELQSAWTEKPDKSAAGRIRQALRAGLLTLLRRERVRNALTSLVSQSLKTILRAIRFGGWRDLRRRPATVRVWQFCRPGRASFAGSGRVFFTAPRLLEGGVKKSGRLFGAPKRGKNCQTRAQREKDAHLRLRLQSLRRRNRDLPLHDRRPEEKVPGLWQAQAQETDRRGRRPDFQRFGLLHNRLPQQRIQGSGRSRQEEFGEIL